MKIVAIAVSVIACMSSVGCASVKDFAETDYVSKIVHALQCDSTTAAVLRKQRRPLDSILVSPVPICKELNVELFERLLGSPTLPAGTYADSVGIVVRRMVSADRYCTEDSTEILEIASGFRNPSSRPIAYLSRQYADVVKGRAMVVGELYMAGAVEGRYRATYIQNSGSFILFIALFERGQLIDFVTGRATP